MTLQLFLVYLVAAIGLSLTPGPNGLLALTHGAMHGLGRSVWTVLGGGLGFFMLIALSLAGLGALLATSSTLFTVAKWCGAAYLVWLGIRIWRAPPPRIALDDAEAAIPPRARALFMEGFWVAVSNPKALIFFAAFLPQFMVPSLGYLPQLLVFGGTFVLIEIVYELMLAGLAQRIAPWLARHGRLFNRIAGTTFIGIGAALTTASR